MLEKEAFWPLSGIAREPPPLPCSTPPHAVWASKR